MSKRSVLAGTAAYGAMPSLRDRPTTRSQIPGQVLWTPARQDAGAAPVAVGVHAGAIADLPTADVGADLDDLAGASAEEAAATQLVVLLALLAVELAAGLLLAELALRAIILPGERLRPTPAAP